RAGALSARARCAIARRRALVPLGAVALVASGLFLFRGALDHARASRKLVLAQRESVAGEARLELIEALRLASHLAPARRAPARGRWRRAPPRQWTGGLRRPGHAVPLPTAPINGRASSAR